MIQTANTIVFSQGNWTQKANFGGSGRSNAVGFSVGAYGYMGTGYTGTPQDDFWRYNPANNTWTQMANFSGGARYAATGFSIGNYGYLGTGVNGTTYYKDFWRYDPAGNSWTKMADFGGTGRFYAFGFSSGYCGYIGTGSNGTVAYNDVWRYNVGSNTWTQRANFNNNRMNAFAFYANGKGYAGCGRNQNGSTYYNNFFEYDSTANTWTARANFPGTAREGVGAFVIGNDGYAGTGGANNFANLYTDFYKFMPASNTWTAVATFPNTARANAATFAVGNFGYLGTGYNLSYTNNFFQYDLCSVTLSVTPTAPNCNGGNNGSINLTVSGATNPLTYAWSNSTSSEDPTGLTAGNYTVLVTDGTGCTKSTTVSVTQPAVLSGTVNITNPACTGGVGTATLVPTGGTPSYTYAWNTTPVQTTASASGLVAGNYTVSLSDSKGCTSTNSFTVTQPSPLTTTLSSTPATCQLCTNGTASVSVGGGTPSFTYSWSTTPVQTGSVASGLLPGTYTVCVTDSKGCSVCDSVQVTFAIGIQEQPSISHIQIFPNPATGNQVQISGMKGTLEISLLDMLGKQIRKSDLILPSTYDLSDLQPGLYFIRIRSGAAVITKKLILDP